MSSRAKHLFRVGSLVVPSVLAWTVALGAPRTDEVTRAVTSALAPLWIAVAAGLALRIGAVLARPPSERERHVSFLARIDILTSAGAALAWTSAAAVVGAVTVGYASLAVVGLLGTGVFNLVVLRGFLALRRAHPFAEGRLERRFQPESVVEGEPVTEELRLSDIAIPIGFRLFIAGRVGPRWATSRHVVEASESGAEIVLESEVGPAVRGEHEAEPLDLWLEDTFGICRSMIARVGGASLAVLPKARQVDRSVSLASDGIGASAPRPTRRLPTEGAFDLREYREGDDVRRIHWVRSLAVGELIVRLPDEIPRDQPRVRLLLDTWFPEALVMSSAAPQEMLDSLVGVWLAMARALADANVRVTLLAVTTRDGRPELQRLEYSRRSPTAALQFGARIAWQGNVPVQDVLTDDATFIVSRGVLAPPPADPKIRFILVPPTEVTEPVWNIDSGVRTAFPLGHPENRWGHRAAAIRELVHARGELLTALRAIQTNVAPPPPGSLVATPLASGLVQLVRLS